MINEPSLTVKWRFRIKPFFRWYDLWVGVYIHTRAKAAYICPMPTLGVKLWVQEYRTCEHCGKEMNKRAYHTGDGWSLHWDCDLRCSDNEDRYIEWPFDGNWMTAKELEECGFKIV